jgi:hypothetical protein
MVSARLASCRTYGFSTSSECGRLISGSSSTGHLVVLLVATLTVEGAREDDTDEPSRIRAARQGTRQGGVFKPMPELRLERGDRDDPGSTLHGPGNAMKQKLPPQLRDGQYQPWEIEMAARYPLVLSEMRWPSTPLDTFSAEPLARWGIEIHAGWRSIMERLLERLEAAIAAQPPDQRDRFRIVQIKEKFGRLTVYLASEATHEMGAALREAEEASIVTCEICGVPGRLAERNAWWPESGAATLGESRLKRSVAFLFDRLVRFLRRGPERIDVQKLWISGVQRFEQTGDEPGIFLLNAGPPDGRIALMVVTRAQKTFNRFTAIQRRFEEGLVEMSGHDIALSANDPGVQRREPRDGATEVIDRPETTG